MAPTLQIFGIVSRFLYSGGWQVCVNVSTGMPTLSVCTGTATLYIYVIIYINYGSSVVTYDVDPYSSHTTGTLDTVKACITT